MYSRAVLILLFTVNILLASTTISPGNVSGTWTSAGSPYLIEGDITVPAGQTLAIEAGVEVLFQDFYGLTVNGTLQAIGSESQPVLFGGGHPTAGWTSINIIEASDNCELTYVIVEKASRTGVLIENVSPLISYCTIRNNKGGGIKMTNSNARLIGNNIINNTNSSSGGGVYIINSPNPELTGNVIDNNAVVRPSSGYIPSTGSGGGIFVRSSNPVLRNNVISNNSVSAARTRGGAIHFYYADPILIGNTITGNTASDGAAIYLYYSELTLINCILWNDVSNEDIYVSENGSSTDAINIAYTDLQGGQTGIVTNGNGTINWLQGNIDADPLFVGMAGGDLQLQSVSPAIDAGTAYFELNGQVLVNMSPSDYNGSAPDMGAFEFGGSGSSNQPPLALASVSPDHGSAPLTVQFSSDESSDPDGTITATDWDFGDGNSSAEANPFHTYITPGIFQVTLTVTDNDGATHNTGISVEVMDGTSVYAGDVFGTWDVDGSPYRIEGDITISSGQTLTIEPGVQVLFQDFYGLTVNGTLLAIGTESQPVLFGGGHPSAGWTSINLINAGDNCQLTHVIVEKASRTGIYIENANPLISYCTIRDNEGGGIKMLNSNARLIGNHIINNINSSSGGGIYMLDSPNPELTGNVIDNNTVIRPPGGFTPTTGSGGGIFARSSDPVMRNNVISNNSVNAVTTRGGGIHFYYSEPLLINNTLTGNAAAEGAGIYLYNSQPVIVNTILWNETFDDEEIFVSTGGVTKPITVAYSDVQGGQAGINTNDNATVNWLAGNLDADPLFVDVNSSDYQLQAGSAAINAGTAYFELNGQILVNLSTSEYNGSAPDLGAFESEFTGPANQAPTANANATPVSGEAPLSVQFSSNGSSDPDGSIAFYSWNFGDGQTSTQASPLHEYQAGTFQAVLTVTDNQGATGQDNITITVNEPSAGDELHVENQIITRQRWFGSFYRAVDEILITDQNNEPVNGVSVTATYSGPNSGQRSGKTGSNGIVTLYSRFNKNPSQGWCFSITDVSKDGYVYNPAANIVTQQCEGSSTSALSIGSKDLVSAYPNPFNPEVNIEFMVVKDSRVDVRIYNSLGQLVKIISDNAFLSEGVHQYRWKALDENGNAIPSGVYFLRYSDESIRYTKRLLYLK